MDQSEDILAWLWRKAAAASAEEREKFMQAASTIETLRELVGIREEMEREEEAQAQADEALAAVKPAGRA